MALLTDIGWAPPDTSGSDPITTEPDAGRKTTGYLPAEKPPAQQHNWLFRQFSRWQLQFKRSCHLAVVGSGSGCTHTTLAAALSDAAVVAGSKILLTENFNIASAIVISKANIHVEALPGVTATKTGGTSGISVEATGFVLRGLRFAAFTTGGDKAIVTAAGGTYARIYDCNFAVSTATEIDDALAPAAVLGCITEV